MTLAVFDGGLGRRGKLQVRWCPKANGPLRPDGYNLHAALSVQTIFCDRVFTSPSCLNNRTMVANEVLDKVPKGSTIILFAPSSASSNQRWTPQRMFSASQALFRVSTDHSNLAGAPSGSNRFHQRSLSDRSNLPRRATEGVSLALSFPLPGSPPKWPRTSDPPHMATSRP